MLNSELKQRLIKLQQECNELQTVMAAHVAIECETDEEFDAWDAKWEELKAQESSYIQQIRDLNRIGIR